MAVEWTITIEGRNEFGDTCRKEVRINGEALLRALMANKRGEPRVCAMVRVPTHEEEDHRLLCR